MDRDERDEQNLIARRNFAAAAMREQQLQQQQHLPDQVGRHLQETELPGMVVCLARISTVVIFAMELSRMTNSRVIEGEEALSRTCSISQPQVLPPMNRDRISLTRKEVNN